MGPQRERPERQFPPEQRESGEPPWTLRERVSLAWDDGSIRWLVGILAVVVLGVGLFAMRSKPVETVMAPQVVRSGTPASTSGVLGSAAASAAGISSTGVPGPQDSTAGQDTATVGAQLPSQVVVHVTGPVRNPGVVTLSAGSRVADAVTAAGGLTKGQVRINLARVLVDGEQIDVGAKQEPAGVVSAGAPGGDGNGNNAVGGGTGASAGGKININKATAAQLEELPRVGPVLASKIIEFRTQFGGFRSIEQLLEVSGIGDATFAQLAPLVTL